MKRYYIPATSVDAFVQALIDQQNKANMFVNIAVKPYHGKKYNPATTVVVVVG